MLLATLATAALQAATPQTVAQIDERVSQSGAKGLSDLEGEAQQLASEGKYWPDSLVPDLQKFEAVAWIGLAFCTMVSLRESGQSVPPTSEAVGLAMSACPKTARTYLHISHLTRYMNEDITPEFERKEKQDIQSFVRDNYRSDVPLEVIERKLVAFVNNATGSVAGPSETGQTKRSPSRPAPPSREQAYALITSELVRYMKDPSSAQISCNAPSQWSWIKESWVHPKHYGYIIRCQLNGRNSFGAYTGFEQHIFVVNGNSVYHIPKLMMGWKFVPVR